MKQWPARHTFQVAWRHGRPGYAEIIDGLLVGEYPLPTDAQWLRDQLQVEVVINLQDHYDLEARALDLRELERAYQRVGITLHHLPTDDSVAGVRERMPEALSLLASHQGRRIYLHCNGGTNRAPTIAIAYLHYNCRHKLDDAIALVSRQRSCLPYLQAFANDAT